MFYDNFVYRRDADHAHAATPLWLVTANAKVRVDPVVERHIARKRIRKGARTFVRRDTKYAIRFHRPDSDGRRSVRDVEPPVNREAISGSCGVCGYRDDERCDQLCQVAQLVFDSRISVNPPWSAAHILSPNVAHIVSHILSRSVAYKPAG